MKRVLLAGRGELTMRLIRYFKERDIETVSVFSEPEVEQPWVEEADYAVYLNGKTVEETYLNVRRVIAACHDAGAEAIHPGYCFFAERLDFYQAAAEANLPVLGAHLKTLSNIVDRFELRKLAISLGIPTIAASDPLGPDDDGLEAASRLGLPVYVKAVHGGAVERVDSYDELSAAVADVRRRALWLTGFDSVYLSGGVPDVRQLATTVVRDSEGSCYSLGHHDKSVQVRFRSWLEELGPTLVSAETAEQMSAAAIRLANAVEWVGVGRVRWALAPNGSFFLLGFSGRLTTGYSLTEQVHEIDLVDAQVRIAEGEALQWDGAQTVPERHGVQLRILHVDPSDGMSRPAGVLERLVLPQGVFAEIGVSVGQECNSETEPLIASLVVTGPTRHAALVKARAALEEVIVQGVVTNVEVLKEVVADPRFWTGGYDVHVVDAHLG